MPTSAEDAKGLLLASIYDNNPVLFLEHRWLHNSLGAVPSSSYQIPLGKARVVRYGVDVTIVAMSYMTVEAMRAAAWLSEHEISCEVIDLRTIKPLDWSTVFASVSKTGRLVVVDTGFTTGSVAAEVIARVAMEKFRELRAAPVRLAMPDVPEPTSPALTKDFHVNSTTIINEVLRMVGCVIDIKRYPLRDQGAHDVPGDWFKGPF